MKGHFPIDKFNALRTPFYYYDTEVLCRTLACIREESSRYENFHVHYAVKANANPKVLAIIRESGLGADCVSGGEIQAAVKAGFSPEKIVFAGVGKADWEINLALDYGIACFNVESLAELEVIDQLAARVRMAPNAFLRQFREITGSTPYQYLLQLRYSYASQLLESRAFSIDEICELIGVKDRFHFSRRFKKLYGAAPAQYRRRHTPQG